MKTIIISLFLIMPLWGLTQNTDCNEMVRMGNEANRKGKLDEALQDYLDAFNCNPKLGTSLIGKIQKVFDDIKDQKEELARKNKQNRKLLNLFFTNGYPQKEADLAKAPAWAQGPDGKYAIINGLGDVLGEAPNKNDRFIWEEPQPFNHDIAIAKKGGEYYFVNNAGEICSNQGYDLIHPTNTGHFLGVQKIGQVNIESVLTDSTGTEKKRIRIQREGFDKASEKYFPFQQDGKWGVMNSEGGFKITPYDTITKFYEGYARVRKSEVITNPISQKEETIYKWGLIDENGVDTMWGGISYQNVGNFQDSVAWVQELTGEFKLITTRKKEVQPDIEGETLLDVFERYFELSIDQGKWIKELTSELNGNSSFDNIQEITKKLGILKIEGPMKNIPLYQARDKYIIVDKDTNQISVLYDKIEPQDSLGSGIYKTSLRSQIGLLVYNSPSNLKKKRPLLIRQLSNDYEEIGFYDPSEDYIRVKQNGKWGYVFWEGKNNQITRKIPCKYDLATKFFQRGDQEVARVYIEPYNLYFYINKQGELLGKVERNKIW